MFSEELAKIDWNTTTAKINAKTDPHVRVALCKEPLNQEDLIALISPAAVPYLEPTAQK